MKFLYLSEKINSFSQVKQYSQLQELENNEYTFYCADGYKGEYELFTEIYKSERIHN